LGPHFGRNVGWLDGANRNAVAIDKISWCPISNCKVVRDRRIPSASYKIVCMQINPEISLAWAGVTKITKLKTAAPSPRINCQKFILKLLIIDGQVIKLIVTNFG
jgi:hypothetical protein